MSESSTRGVVAETVALPNPVDVLALMHGTNPLLWWRRGNGMVGVGLLEKLVTSGKPRVLDASAAWKEIVTASSVHDEVHLPGTGLIAFGTFAFSRRSAMPSTMVIPRLVIGQRDGASWLTRLRFADEAASALTSESASAMVAELGRASGSQAGAEQRPHLSFAPGQQSERGYLATVTEAVERIRRGEVEKVVLARDVVGQLRNGDDLRVSIRALAEAYPDCWTFAVDGLFGSSPETLVSVHDNRVSARVLAGTARRGHDSTSDLANATALASSPKDLDEHGFAVRSVVDALAPHTEHLTLSDNPFTLKLPNLWHLATDISGRLPQGSSSLDLVAALHPTAAVAGTPMLTAADLIFDLEPFDRGRYAGPVGWIDAEGNGEWAIALRCAQWSGATVTAYAGCGIVADSVAENELAETVMKFRPIVDALS